MASKNILSLLTVTLLVLSILSHATSASPFDSIHRLKGHKGDATAASPFDFIHRLKGSHKGDNVQGIQDVKKYLEHFGYLNGHSINDVFDDQLESAIKTYQLNYHLKATGTLDVETVSQMIKPRCGFPDIINGTNSMHPHNHGLTHRVVHYSFFQGQPKWPASKYNLTYALLRGTPAAAVAPIARAFQTWEAVTQFTFRRVQSIETADLKISFEFGNHGDGAPFDGRYGTLAHAFAPTRGLFHFDASEKWVVGSMEGGFDLETVAVHEIGHLLGLSHSSVYAAIMYPEIDTGVVKTQLDEDDIEGIKALYNF